MTARSETSGQPERQLDCDGGRCSRDDPRSRGQPVQSGQPQAADQDDGGCPDRADQPLGGRAQVESIVLEFITRVSSLLSPMYGI